MSCCEAVSAQQGTWTSARVHAYDRLASSLRRSIRESRPDPHDSSLLNRQGEASPWPCLPPTESGLATRATDIVSRGHYLGGFYDLVDCVENHGDSECCIFASSQGYRNVCIRVSLRRVTTSRLKLHQSVSLHLYRTARRLPLLQSSVTVRRRCCEIEVLAVLLLLLLLLIWSAPRSKEFRVRQKIPYLRLQQHYSSFNLTLSSQLPQLQDRQLLEHVSFCRSSPAFKVLNYLTMLRQRIHYQKWAVALFTTDMACHA